MRKPVLSDQIAEMRGRFWIWLWLWLHLRFTYSFTIMGGMQFNYHAHLRVAPIGKDLHLKLIMNVEITEGYEKWVNTFHSADAVRQQYGVTVLAFGHDKDDETSVYQVLEVESMEKMQEAMSSPEIQKMRTDAGVNLDSQKLTFLVE